MTDKRHFLELRDFSPKLLRAILADAHKGKAARAAHGRFDLDAPLRGKVVGLIFELPSTRTRVSFEVGVRELGGEPLVLSSRDMQIGRDESIGDTARVLSRYLDLIMIRTPNSETLYSLAEHGTVPVINGLTRDSHPCQILADIMTFEESLGPLEGQTMAWIGDCNNVFASLAEASGKLGFSLKIAAPDTLKPSPDQMAHAREVGAKLEIFDDPEAAVQGAAAVLTDCWVSMGDDQASQRHNLLAPFQVNDQLIARAAPGAIFMHCLPAHRGEEVTDSVMDGAQSRVFDEAENRLHVQKSIMKYCLLGEIALNN